MCRAIDIIKARDKIVLYTLRLKELKKIQLYYLSIILGSLVEYCNLIENYIEIINKVDNVEVTNCCLLDENWGFIHLDENMTEEMYLKQKNTYNLILVKIKWIRQIIESYFENYSKITIYISNRNIFTNIKWKINSHIEKMHTSFSETFDAPLISMVYDFTQIFNDLYNNSRIHLLTII